MLGGCGFAMLEFVQVFITQLETDYRSVQVTWSELDCHCRRGQNLRPGPLPERSASIWFHVVSGGASRTKQETTQKNSSLTPCQHVLQKSTHIFDDTIFVNYLTILNHPRKHLRHLGPILGMTSRMMKPPMVFPILAAIIHLCLRHAMVKGSVETLPPCGLLFEATQKTKKTSISWVGNNLEYMMLKC